jgi:hypothetical protein
MAGGEIYARFAAILEARDGGTAGSLVGRHLFPHRNCLLALGMPTTALSGPPPVRKSPTPMSACRSRRLRARLDYSRALVRHCCVFDRRYAEQGVSRHAVLAGCARGRPSRPARHDQLPSERMTKARSTTTRGSSPTVGSERERTGDDQMRMVLMALTRSLIPIRHRPAD